MPKELERQKPLPVAPEVLLDTESVESSEEEVAQLPEPAQNESVPPEETGTVRGAPSVAMPQAQVSTQSPTAKDTLTLQVEKVLEEDMTELFLAMKPQDQRVFAAAGEETAGKIRLLLASAAKNAQKILELIRVWLLRIPGVSRFFLEQEAKIKTDKILHLNP